jgi:CheY-like chemotaxis protein
MRPTTRELIDAIVTALEQEVAPLVQDKWAASVLRSATQLLNHLSLRVEDGARVLIEDNKDVRYVLETVYRSLSVNADTASLRAAVEEALKATESPHHDVAALDARNEAYLVAVETLLKHRSLVRQATGGTSVQEQLREYMRRRLKREHHLYFPVFTGPPF